MTDRVGSVPIDLLALPCAGASANMYLRWRRLLPAWVRLVPVELPGRGSRLEEPCARDFDALVARLCDEHAAAMRGRYALFGHSMGALLAYGIATRQHERGGAMPRALFVSASSAPSRRDPDRFAARGDRAALIADLRKQGGTPEELFAHEELLDLTLRTLDADYAVCESFRHMPRARLPVPLHVLTGRHDDIEADRIEAWREEAGHAFTLDWFEGGHFYIRDQERPVLETVRRLLASGDAEGAGQAAMRADKAGNQGVSVWM